MTSWGGQRTPKPWPGCARRTTRSLRARPSGWPSGPPTCSGPASRADAPGLDVSGLAGVIAVDVHPDGAATADVQGMCTYEDLVDVTLPRGFIPLRRPAAAHHHPRRRGHRARHRVDVVPQRAAARVGAGDGRADRRRRGRAPRPPGEDLFDAFPNSYGSLGYATRLRIRLERVPAYVDLRHLRFDDLDALAKTIEVIVEQRRARRRPGRRPRRRGVRAGGGLPDAGHLDRPGPTGPADERTSDYTGMDLYFRSLQQRETDTLTMYDYLWRWDTDWFWCSGAFGLQNPRDPPALAAPVAAQRRLPPARRPGEPLRRGRPHRPRAGAGPSGSG